MAKAGARIAVHSTNKIVFFDKQGVAVEHHGAPLGYEASGVTADAQGNVYFAAPSGVYSLDSVGNQRWSLPYGSATPDNTAVPGQFTLSSDGVLYGVTSDGVLRAIRAKDGWLLWSQKTEMWHSMVANVMGGTGDVLFVAGAGGGMFAFDAKTGEALGRLGLPDGNDISGSFGTWALGWEVGIVSGYAFNFDLCGRLRWQTWTPEKPYKGTKHGIIGLGEVLVGSDFETDERGSVLGISSLSLHAADGQVKVGPLPRNGQPFLAGADGTIYTVYCELLSPGTPAGTNQLIAYGPDLTELWRLDLGGACPAGNGILDDDGVLYLARNNADWKLELLAIQTRSPGLADSSWPSLRHDNRGTAWLVPGVPSSATPTP